MKQYLCLKASAGSGKTFALTVRYISLLLQDVDVSSILTLTFTNKAALEMSERIYSTLNTLGDDEAILNAISNDTKLNIQQILEKKEIILKNFISNELSIYTIDKFINKILREFAGYIDISDDFSISNDDEDLMLYKFLASLDFKQFDLLINFSHNYNKKLDSIISLFKVLDEKNEKLDIIKFDKSLLDVVISSILESALKIKEYVLKSSLTPSAKKAVEYNDIDTLLDKGKTWLSKDSLSEFSYFKKDKNIDSLDIELYNIKENLAFYFKLKQSDILNALFTIFNNFKFFRRKYKNEKNQFEFRDITNFVYELMSNHIDKDFLYFRLDVKYNHILIDEFQDTSVLQYKILEPLIKEILSGSSEAYKTFFYVGDTKQSIYRFRGGNKELFDFVRRDNEQIQLQVLDKNYRSSKNVVEFVNKTFENLYDYEYHAQKIYSNNIGCVEINSLYLDDTNKYEDVKNKIEELLKIGIDEKNIAILTYTNKDVLELYEYLSSQLPKVKLVTELTSLLINQLNVKAVINYIKYLYFKEDIYKSNFNALMGYEIDKELILKINLQNNTMENIVYSIVSEYNLIDDNMIKFLNIVSSYKDIVDFIYEIDNDETTMINKEKSGLQILTVFKSKGLEFDTVIVLDRISRKNSDKSTILFEYKDIELQNIYYKIKYRENFDEQYFSAIENEKQLVRADELNILYVALTRAKNNLIIFKKDKQSAFDNLSFNMEFKKIGQWYINPKKKLLEQKQEVNYTPINLGYQEVQKTQQKDDKDNLKARYFGIATHYCLELMAKFDINSLNQVINMVKSKYYNILNDEDIKDIYNRINLLITNKQFISLIKETTYTKEQELSFNNEIKIIDLLLKKEKQYTIIDYKTSSNEQDSHIKQVKYYKKAILNITNQKDIKGFVVYLHKDNISFLEVI